MLNSRKWSCLLLLAGLGLSSVALAKDAQPSGTIQVASKSVSLGIGVDWGQGTLHYQGKDYTFSVTGLTVLDLGISSITASGDVFNLKREKDLAGNYVAGAAGLTIAGGADDVIMTNDQGVVIHLHGVERGVRLQLGAQGMTVKLQS